MVWQLKSSLALGVSAWGAALTLAVTMAGLCLGSLAMGRWLKEHSHLQPIRLYAGLELIIGLAGLALTPAFVFIERLDTHVYMSAPAVAPLLHIAGIALALGIATIAMGATLPVFGLVAKQFGTKLSVLYALNTLGAALGALLAAFVLIPLFGVNETIRFIAGLNIVIALLTLLLKGGVMTAAAAVAAPQEGLPPRLWLVAAVTGFTTLLLEVAWFRSLVAAFGSTTDAFAVMLAAVLLGLGAGARMVPLLQRINLSVGQLLGAAGIAILLVTPVIERFDLVTSLVYSDFPFLILGFFLASSLVLLGVPMLLLGTALPWLLDERQAPQYWGRLYALNSSCAVAGALLAGWVFLPIIGFAQTAWLAGVLVVVASLPLLLPAQRLRVAVLGALALAGAVAFTSGAGHTRAQANFASSRLQGGRVLESYNGPDVTSSAVEYASGIRALIIDGTLATAQPGRGDVLLPAHYMPWMGHLPMLLHPAPQRALVICFGTGQTANAVRSENPASLDIVDINEHVFDLSDNFTANLGVLDDPRVHPVVMDGRAYLRRSLKQYDVITLEPMPPTHVGVNALYSQEFYQLARQRLTKDGVIAQWLPFHLLTPYHAAAIARTFQSVFPNAILWLDPASTTGILVASKNDEATMGTAFPGFTRTGSSRDMDEAAVRKALLLDRAGVERLGSYAEVITDDNQLLAYGSAVHPAVTSPTAARDSLDFAILVSQQP